MIVFPAIDIKDGKVVRLSQGKFQEMTIYSTDPVGTAKKWEAAGASWLHIVDLDGAEKGEMKNFGAIREIVKEVKIPVQMGGGIRTEDDIKKMISCGVNRVILGTKVVEDKDFVRSILSQWAGRVIVSLDCSRGMVTQKGWTTLSNIKAADMANELQGMGLSALIYTDIARDGTLIGPNIKGIKDLLAAVKMPIIASGGVSSLEDMIQLKQLEASGLIGAIVGKALYENRLYLKDAIDVCSRKE